MSIIIQQNSDLNGLPRRGICRLALRENSDPWRHLSRQRSFNLGRWHAGGCEVVHYADAEAIRAHLIGATFLSYAEIEALTGISVYDHARDDHYFWLDIVERLEELWPFDDGEALIGTGGEGGPPEERAVDLIDEDPGRSIFAGTDQIIDGWLGLGGLGFGAPPHYRHRTAFLAMLQPPATLPFDGAELVRRLLARITKNWEAAQASAPRSPSCENWRFRKELFISDNNQSHEKRLEKSIAMLADDDWANQIPTASGLVNPHGRQHNIDLARRDDRQYWLFELKWDSDNPLSAAMQILRYGTLYLFWRLHPNLACDVQAQPVLSATAVHLRVLAPQAYYDAPNRHGSLAWLEKAISDGIAAIAVERGITMDFRFDAFHEPFYVPLYH